MFNKICKKCGKEYQDLSRNRILCQECRIRPKKEIKSKFIMNNFNNDIEGLSYVLGYMYADGYLDVRHRCYIMSTDLEIIEKIRDRSGYSYSIRCQESKHGYKPVYRIIYYSNNSDFFESYGMTNNKLNLRLPDLSKIDFYAFLRGMFDGDGNLSLLKDGGFSSIIFLGNENLLTEIRDYLGYGRVYRDRSKNVWILQYSSNRGQCILDKMYANSTIYLDRKYNTYLKMKRCKKKVEQIPLGKTYKEIDEMYGKYAEKLYKAGCRSQDY